MGTHCRDSNESALEQKDLFWCKSNLLLSIPLIYKASALLALLFDINLYV